MKKILGAIAALAMTVGLAAVAHLLAKGQQPKQISGWDGSRYPPFNWTQKDDSNGARKFKN